MMVDKKFSFQDYSRVWATDDHPVDLFLSTLWGDGVHSHFAI